MSFKRKHTIEEKRKIGESIKKMYANMNEEKNEMRKKKLSEIMSLKNKLYNEYMQNSKVCI